MTMLSYAKFLAESFDSAVPYSWVKVGPNTHCATFRINGKKYRTYFAPILQSKDNAFTVDFEYRPNALGSRMDATGTGDEFKVFATVGKQSLDFIKKFNPTELHFTTDEESRQRLYAKFAARLASETGYKLKQASDGIYVLVKP